MQPLMEAVLRDVVKLQLPSTGKGVGFASSPPTSYVARMGRARRSQEATDPSCEPMELGFAVIILPLERRRICVKYV